MSHHSSVEGEWCKKNQGVAAQKPMSKNVITWQSIVNLSDQRQLLHL